MNADSVKNCLFFIAHGALNAHIVDWKIANRVQNYIYTVVYTYVRLWYEKCYYERSYYFFSVLIRNFQSTLLFIQEIDYSKFDAAKI